MWDWMNSDNYNLINRQQTNKITLAKYQVMLANPQQASSRRLSKYIDKPSKIMGSIYASRLAKNSPSKLSPIKLETPSRKTRDFYTFQRSLASSHGFKIPDIIRNRTNQETKRNTFRQTFSNSRNQSKNFTLRNRSMVNDRIKSNNSRMITSESKRNSPLPEPKKIMNNTSFNFRPPTGFRRFGDQDHNNYLSRYQIIKELGKGTYGVVHLARQKNLKANNDRIGKESLSPQKEQKQTSPKKQQLSIQIKDLQTQKQLLVSSIQTTKSAASKNENKEIEKEGEREDMKLFAIKVYEKFKMNKDPTKFKNIRKQINIMQNIEHEHIIKLYESVDTLTKISLVVEYGGDYSLLDYLKKNYPLSDTLMKKIARELLSAVCYLHEKNIVHRDIKLQNILMLNETVKLIDFGFSTLTHRSRKLNAICGTPNYMAPQLLSKKEYYGEHADIWSYGVVIFALGEGRHPFKAETYNQLERLVNRGGYQFKKMKDPIYQSFVKRILRLKPEQRPRATDLFSHPWLVLKD